MVSVHHGHGGNGKSKYFGAIQNVLGPYAVEPHKSLVMATKHDQHPTVLATMFRVRLAVLSETSQSASLNESEVKNLTGGDRLRARRMREDEWSFDPTHTLVMFSNHRPTIKGTDEGVWRRVRLIPWSVTIPECERDDHLAEKLAAEASGILLWIVEGARQYLATGLSAPEIVTAATASYRADQDTVSQFLVWAGISFDSNGQVQSSIVMDLHTAWCEENAVTSQQSHWAQVVELMKANGAEAGKFSKVRHWFGITVS
jgi:putative DNA primase/helicase